MLGFVGNRNWVYPQAIHGTWTRLRWATFALLHLILFVTPWIPVGGHPAVRVDLPGRTLYVLGQIFTAADTIFLLLLLLFLAFSLFFFTSLLGRVWCGYACPQTVFLHTIVLPLEEWIEGSRNQRMKRDLGPWTLDKAWRKGLKWALFAALAGLVSAAFTVYFTGPRAFWTGQAGSTAYTIWAIFAGAWFLDLAWFREQFCNYLCPYARFQSVLADDESLVVTYDPRRGDPRGGPSARAEGRCIECNKCVAVCPQGIDIRNGFQLECIACARCVDACASVMSKLGHETLVDYGTLAALEGKRVRRLRPRTVVYAGLLTGLAAAAAVLLVTRTPIEAQVGRLPGSLFTVDGDGWVRNTYMLRISNKQAGTARVPYTVQVEGLRDAQVLAQPVELASDESRVLPLVVRVRPSEHMERTIPIRVRVASPRAAVTLDATFKTPGEVDDDHPSVN